MLLVSLLLLEAGRLNCLHTQSLWNHAGQYHGCRFRRPQRRPRLAPHAWFHRCPSDHRLCPSLLLSRVSSVAYPEGPGRQGLPIICYPSAQQTASRTRYVLYLRRCRAGTQGQPGKEHIHHVPRFVHRAPKSACYSGKLDRHVYAT